MLTLPQTRGRSTHANHSLGCAWDLQMSSCPSSGPAAAGVGAKGKTSSCEGSPFAAATTSYLILPSFSSSPLSLNVSGTVFPLPLPCLCLQSFWLCSPSAPLSRWRHLLLPSVFCSLPSSRPHPPSPTSAEAFPSLQHLLASPAQPSPRALP